MGLLYYFETTIDFQGEHSHNVFRKWLNIAEEFIAYPSKTTGVEIKQFWKICGENKLIGGITQLDLCNTWTDEAVSAIEAKKLGDIVDLWKVVAERQVWVIVRMNSLKDADELLTFDLPILKKMGAQVYTKCKSIRLVNHWIEDLQTLV